MKLSELIDALNDIEDRLVIELELEIDPEVIFNGNVGHIGSAKLNPETGNVELSDEPNDTPQPMN